MKRPVLFGVCLASALIVAGSVQTWYVTGASDRVASAADRMTTQQGETVQQIRQMLTQAGATTYRAEWYDAANILRIVEVRQGMIDGREEDLDALVLRYEARLADEVKKHPPVKR